jgi:SAM-dependent methyltransferase
MSEMDETDNKARWDCKYEEGLPSLTVPDPFFVSAYERFVERSFPNAGTALDVAAGLGRHALWLAHRGWQVNAADISEVAIRKLRQAAGQLDLEINLFTIDAAQYQFRPAQFDLIVLFYHLDRGLFPKIASALKPGGLFICKMPVHWDSEIPSAKTNFNLLDRNEIASLVPDLEIIEHQERPVRDRGVAEFAGKRPESRKELPMDTSSRDLEKAMNGHIAGKAKWFDSVPGLVRQEWKISRRRSVVSAAKENIVI